MPHAVVATARTAIRKHAWSLGFDGVWYAGGPWGLHPECGTRAPAK